MESRSFYNEILTEHNIHPEFKHDLPDADLVLEGVNPNCGDDIFLKLKLDGDEIVDGAFVGDGCAISQASADIMLGMIVGKKKEEALHLGELFLKMIKGEASDEEIDELEEASALKDISHMPARVKCAVLGWHTLEEMLNDERIAKLVDFADAKDCFTGVNIAGGVFYFLWDSNHEGNCEVSNFFNNKIQSTVSRSLNEFKFIVRNNTAVSIIKKCIGSNEETMEDMVSSRNMFGIATTTKGKTEPFENSIEALTSKGTIYLSPDEIADKGEYLDKYKVIITYAMSGGNKPNKSGQYKITSSMQVLKPYQACSETYLCIGRFDNEKDAENLKSYISTKTFRFLLLQALTSIHITKDKFCFIPKQDFSKSWTDQELYKKYEFTEDEINYIENLITPAD